MRLIKKYAMGTISRVGDLPCVAIKVFFLCKWRKKCKFEYSTNIFTGLQTSENSKFYAISSRFKPFSNKGKTLVIQYTVKHEQKIDCGGGYVKIFSSNLDQKNLSGDSHYYIMFGEFIVISSLLKYSHCCCGNGRKKI